MMPSSFDTSGATALLHRYLAACQALDTRAILACFAADAEVVDPLRDGIRGTAEIGRYFEEVYDGLASLTFTVSDLYWCGSEAACHWQGRAVRSGGAVLAYAGIDVFSIAQHPPLIARLRAYWRPADLVG